MTTIRPTPCASWSSAATRLLRKHSAVRIHSRLPHFAQNGSNGCPHNLEAHENSLTTSPFELRRIIARKEINASHSLDGSQSSIELPSGSLSHAKVPMPGYSSVFSITTPLLLRWLRASPMFFTV